MNTRRAPRRAASRAPDGEASAITSMKKAMGSASTSTTTTANVTAKALTLAAVTDTKTYDGTTSSGATVTVTGLEGNDTASVSQAFTNKNVLGANGSTLQVNSGYTINDGNSGNNYSVSTSTATGTINKAALTVAMSNQTKTYDGTTAATLASAALRLMGAEKLVPAPVALPPAEDSLAFSSAVCQGRPTMTPVACAVSCTRVLL